MEWAATAILSQGKYGIYNPISSIGENGTKDFQIWNNPSYNTGNVGSNKNSISGVTGVYNSEKGPNASTTGTVYGIYDMAAGAWEYVMGVMTNSERSIPMDSQTGFMGTNNPWPDSKYYDFYTPYVANDANSYNGAKIGDASDELNISQSSYTWNGDSRLRPYFNYAIILRGGWTSNGETAPGIFARGCDTGYARNGYTFRAGLISL